MGDTKHLYSTDAVKKIKELAEGARTCLFATALTKIPLSARPMALQKVDEEGCLWFFSEKESDKNQDIKDDDRVQLFFEANNNSEYLSIYGHAEISFDKKKIEELWTAWAKTWFQGGKDDPSISVIKVKPEEGYYWDTKHNKMISLLKIAASVVTGKTMDDGLEGKLKL